MVPFRGGLAAQMDHIGIVLGLDVAEHEGVSLSYDMQVKNMATQMAETERGRTRLSEYFQTSARL